VYSLFLVWLLIGVYILIEKNRVNTTKNDKVVAHRSYSEISSIANIDESDQIQKIFQNIRPSTDNTVTKSIIPMTSPPHSKNELSSGNISSKLVGPVRIDEKDPLSTEDEPWGEDDFCSHRVRPSQTPKRNPYLDSE